jgi:hypothetical protein
MPTKTDELLLSYLQNDQLGAISDYVGRGRRHAQLELEDVRRQWVSEFRRWVVGLRIGRSLNRRIHEDFESELRIRQIEPPWEVVRQDIEGMREAMEGRMRRLARDHPAKFAEQRRRFDDELERFQQGSEQPTRN